MFSQKRGLKISQDLSPAESWLPPSILTDELVFEETVAAAGCRCPRQALRGSSSLVSHRTGRGGGCPVVYLFVCLFVTGYHIRGYHTVKTGWKGILLLMEGFDILLNVLLLCHSNRSAAIITRQ